MVSSKETCPVKLRGGGAAVKEGCRILATTFLSLLLPLSFLLLTRLSIHRYFSSVTKYEQHKKISFLISLFLQSKTTLILSVLVSVVAIAALVQGLTGNKSTFLINERRRLYAAWVMLFLVQVFLSLGIHGTVDAEISSYTVGDLVLPRRLVFALGLHEMMVFWRRNVVKPVVDETIFGFSDEGFGWMEKVVSAIAFGNLWWRRLRDEAEALVVLPWVMVELRMDVEAADVLGWSLYYLTVAIGGVWVLKGLRVAVIRIFRHRHQPVIEGDNATKNSSV